MLSVNKQSFVMRLKNSDERFYKFLKKGKYITVCLTCSSKVAKIKNV